MLCLLSGEESPKGEIPPGIIEAAKKAGVLDLLGRDSAVRAALGKEGSAFLYQAVLGSTNLKELKHISETLAENKIPVIALKGMAYALMFEKGGPTRSMADIDLLVSEEHYEEACRLVMDQGYRELDIDQPMSRNIEQYHERAFVKGDVMFEVHQRFLPGERIAVDYQGLWKRTRPTGDECPDCRLLGPEDTFLYHCFHMGMHEFLYGLRPVWELRRLILLDKPDLEISARRAREWGTLSMTWCSLRLLEICFPGTLKEDDMKRFAPVVPRARMLERFIVQPSIELLQNSSNDRRPPTAASGPYGPTARRDRSKRMTRKIQLFRKALMVDRPVGAVKYFLLWAKNKVR